MEKKEEKEREPELAPFCSRFHLIVTRVTQILALPYIQTYTVAI